MISYHPSPPWKISIKSHLISRIPLLHRVSPSTQEISFCMRYDQKRELSHHISSNRIRSLATNFFCIKLPLATMCASPRKNTDSNSFIKKEALSMLLLLSYLSTSTYLIKNCSFLSTKVFLWSNKNSKMQEVIETFGAAPSYSIIMKMNNSSKHHVKYNEQHCFVIGSLSAFKLWRDNKALLWKGISFIS